MRFRLARDVAEALVSAGVEFAVVGAAALPAHGYARATQDLDLLVCDRRALSDATWKNLAEQTRVQIRVTDDDDDPVIGVVRVGSAGRRQCDVVMPRGPWHKDVIARAQAEGPRLRVSGVDLPVATLGDLIAMKLEAGGPLDLRDVHELLNVRPEAERDVRRAVDPVVRNLSERTRAAWAQVVAERSKA